MVDPRGKLQELLTRKRAVRGRRCRRREQPDYDLAQATSEADEGWRKYRALLVVLKLRRVAEHIHRFVLACWIIFYLFLKDFAILSPQAETFLSREEVVAAGAFSISWVLFQAYRAGPIWIGVFTLLGIVMLVLAFIGVL